MWQSTIESFVGEMKSRNLQRAYLVTDPKTGRLEASDPFLKPVVEAVASDTRDYRAHQGCFFEIGSESGHLLSAFVHRTIRGQAAGGVRFWTYKRLEDFIRDGLRLSIGMGQKNALAGLWWGGGKGVVARRKDRDHRDPEVRRAVYQDYGRFISSLRGCYVTAEDVGTTPEDMAWVFSTTRHTTCIPPRVGGSGNPSELTGKGVVVAIEAALEYLGLGTVEGKTVAVQGLGNVSRFCVEALLERGVKRIVGADIDPVAAARLEEQLPDDRLELGVVPKGDNSILAQPADVVVPNAVGAVLNPATIPTIRARIVCGGANNQLEDPVRDAAALGERGVLYVPDFLANRMGIVNCSNEQYGVFEGDPAIVGHLDRGTPAGIHQRCMEVFRRAEATGQTPAAEAEALAEELSREPHPVWGNRGQEIIDYLVKSRWAEQPPITE